MKEITIGTRRIGQQQPPLVIAEIGINHEGDIRLAKKMVSDSTRRMYCGKTLYI